MLPFGAFIAMLMARKGGRAIDVSVGISIEGCLNYLDVPVIRRKFAAIADLWNEANSITFPSKFLTPSRTTP